MHVDVAKHMLMLFCVMQRSALRSDLHCTTCCTMCCTMCCTIHVLTFGSSEMMSPSRTNAIGPPTAASGETWPTMIPWDAPVHRRAMMNPWGATEQWEWTHAVCMVHCAW